MRAKLLLAGFWTICTVWLVVISLRESDEQVARELFFLTLASRQNISFETNMTDRQEDFVNYFALLAERENRRIERTRKILALISRSGTAEAYADSLEILKLYYRISADQSDQGALQELDVRIGQIPIDLVVAQAAIESGWGSSRFARDASNFFGEQCFSHECGLKPLSVNLNSNVRIRIFDNPAESVASYFRNLNTHAAYSELRQVRRKRLKADEAVRASDLIPSLIEYAETGKDYLKLLKTVSSAPLIQTLASMETRHD